MVYHENNTLVVIAGPSVSHSENDGMNLVISSVEGSKTMEIVPSFHEMTKIKSEPGTSETSTLVKAEVLDDSGTNDLVQAPALVVSAQECEQQDSGNKPQSVPQVGGQEGEKEQAEREDEQREVSKETKTGDAPLLMDSDSETDPYSEPAFDDDSFSQRLLQDPYDKEIDAKVCAEFDDYGMEDDNESVSSHSTIADSTSPVTNANSPVAKTVSSPGKNTMRRKFGVDIRRWEANGKKPLEAELPLIARVPQIKQKDQKGHRLNESMVTCLSQCECDKEPMYPGPHYHCMICHKYTTDKAGMMMRHRVMKHQIVPYGLNVIQCCICKRVYLQISEYIRDIEKHAKNACLFTEPVQRFLETEMHYAKIYGFALRKDKQIQLSVPPAKFPTEKTLNVSPKKESPRKTKANSTVLTTSRSGSFGSQIPVNQVNGNLHPLDESVETLCNVARVEQLHGDEQNKYISVKITESGIRKEIQTLSLDENDYTQVSEGLSCKRCSAVFQTPSQLNGHLVSAHKLRGACNTYVCDLCSVTFYVDDKFIKHCASKTHVSNVKSILAQNDQAKENSSVQPESGSKTSGHSGAVSSYAATVEQDSGKTGSLSEHLVEQDGGEYSSLSVTSGIDIGGKTCVKPLTTDVESVYQAIADGLHKKMGRHISIVVGPKVITGSTKKVSQQLVERHKDKFKCSMCPFITDTKYYCAEHVFVKHEIDAPCSMYFCKLCNYRTGYKKQFMVHCSLSSSHRNSLKMVSGEAIDLKPSLMASPQKESKPIILRQQRISEKVHKRQLILKEGVYTGAGYLPLTTPLQQIHSSVLGVQARGKVSKNSKTKTYFQVDITPLGIRKVKRVSSRTFGATKVDGLWMCQRCHWTTKHQWSCANHILSVHQEPIPWTTFTCRLCHFQNMQWDKFFTHCTKPKHCDRLQKAMDAAADSEALVLPSEPSPMPKNGLSGGTIQNSAVEGQLSDVELDPVITKLDPCESKKNTYMRRITKPGCIPLSYPITEVLKSLEDEIEYNSYQGDSQYFVEVTSFGVRKVVKERETHRNDPIVFSCELCQFKTTVQLEFEEHCKLPVHLEKIASAIKSAKLPGACQKRRKKEIFSPHRAASQQESVAETNKVPQLWMLNNAGTKPGNIPLTTSLESVLPEGDKVPVLRITKFGVQREGGDCEKQVLICELCSEQFEERQALLHHCSDENHKAAVDAAVEESKIIYTSQFPSQRASEDNAFSDASTENSGPVPSTSAAHEHVDQVPGVTRKTRGRRARVYEDGHPPLTKVQRNGTAFALADGMLPLNFEMRSLYFDYKELVSIKLTMYGISVHRIGGIDVKSDRLTCELCMVSFVNRDLFLLHCTEDSHTEEVEEAIGSAVKLYHRQQYRKRNGTIENFSPSPHELSLAGHVTTLPSVSLRQSSRKTNSLKTHYPPLCIKLGSATAEDFTPLSAEVEDICSLLAQNQGAMPTLIVTKFGIQVINKDAMHECQLCSALLISDQLAGHLKSPDHRQQVSDAIASADRIYQSQRAEIVRTKFINRQNQTKKQNVRERSSANVTEIADIPLLTRVSRKTIFSAVAAHMISLSCTIFEILSDEEGKILVVITPYGTLVHYLEDAAENVFSCELCSVNTSIKGQFLQHCDLDSHLQNVRLAIKKSICLFTRQRDILKKFPNTTFKVSPYYEAIARSAEGTGPKIVHKEKSAYCKHNEKFVGQRFGRFNRYTKEPLLKRVQRNGKVTAVAAGMQSLVVSVPELLTRHPGHASIKVTPYGSSVRTVASEDTRVFECEICGIPSTSSVKDFLVHCSGSDHLMRVNQTIDEKIYVLNRQIAAKSKGIKIRYKPSPHVMDTAHHSPAAGHGEMPAGEVKTQTAAKTTVPSESNIGVPIGNPSNTKKSTRDESCDNDTDQDNDIAEITDDDDDFDPLNATDDGLDGSTLSLSSMESGANSGCDVQSQKSIDRATSTSPKETSFTRSTRSAVGPSKNSQVKAGIKLNTRTPKDQNTSSKSSLTYTSSASNTNSKSNSLNKDPQKKTATSSSKNTSNPTKNDGNSPRQIDNPISKLTMPPNAPQIIEKILPGGKKSYILNGYLPLETTMYEATETLRSQRPDSEGLNVRYKIEVTSYGFVQNRIPMDKDVLDPVAPIPQQGMIKCKICGFATITKQPWETHMAEKHPDVCKYIYNCKPCTYLCLKPSTFYRHGKSDDHIGNIKVAGECAHRLFRAQNSSKDSNSAAEVVEKQLDSGSGHGRSGKRPRSHDRQSERSTSPQELTSQERTKGKKQREVSKFPLPKASKKYNNLTYNLTVHEEAPLPGPKPWNTSQLIKVRFIVFQLLSLRNPQTLSKKAMVSRFSPSS